MDAVHASGVSEKTLRRFAIRKANEFSSNVVLPTCLGPVRSWIRPGAGSRSLSWRSCWQWRNSFGNSILE